MTAYNWTRGEGGRQSTETRHGLIGSIKRDEDGTYRGRHEDLIGHMTWLCGFKTAKLAKAWVEERLQHSTERLYELIREGEHSA